MNKYDKKVKKAAMKKTGYSNERAKISRNLTNNKKNVAELKKGRDRIKNNMAEFIVKAELYHKVYKDLEFIISGVNRTNGKLRIKKIINGAPRTKHTKC